MEQQLPVGVILLGRPLDWSKTVWNDLGWRQSRLTAMRALLADNPYESNYVVENLGAQWKDLDLELVNRDLGWGRGSKLLATIIFDERDIDEINQIGSGPPLKPSYHIDCKVLRQGMRWQDKVGRAPQEGDFGIRISEEGILNEVSFRKTPPVAEEWKDGELVLMEVACVSGVDCVDLLNQSDSEERNREVAGIADLILALLVQQGRQLTVPPRTP